MKKLVLLASFLLTVPSVYSFAENAAADATAGDSALPGAPTKAWKNAAELSFVNANGNTKSQTFAGKDTYNYNWSKTSLELIGAALTASDKGQTIAEKYASSEKLAYQVSEQNYLYEKVGWDKDRFSGIKTRWDSTAGFGHEFIKTPRNLFLGELGAGYLVEDRYDEKQNDFATGRAYGKYVFTISKTSAFSQDAEYLHNFENPDDFRAKTETNLTAAISVHFSMKAYFIWKYVGVPPAGIGRNDTLTGVALVATY